MAQSTYCKYRLIQFPVFGNTVSLWLISSAVCSYDTDLTVERPQLSVKPLTMWSQPAGITYMDSFQIP